MQFNLQASQTSHRLAVCKLPQRISFHSPLTACDSALMNHEFILMVAYCHFAVIMKLYLFYQSVTSVAVTVVKGSQMNVGVSC